MTTETAAETATETATETAAETGIAAGTAPGTAPGIAAGVAGGAHAFAFDGIDGSRIRLADFAGRPVLVVNTASACGYTPQYVDLERLWRAWGERGLVVIGVPSNDFGDQEPGSDEEILAFCTRHFATSFPLARKARVVGEAAHPFYRWIAAELGEDWAPRWNFHKYLIAPDGSVAAAWPARVRPLDPEVIAAIGALVA
jgi:glutathione peroxidase